MAADGRSSCSGLLLTALMAVMLLPGEFTAGALNGCCRVCYRSLACVTCSLQKGQTSRSLRGVTCANGYLQLLICSSL